MHWLLPTYQITKDVIRIIIGLRPKVLEWFPWAVYDPPSEHPFDEVPRPGPPPGPMTQAFLVGTWPRSRKVSYLVTTNEEGGRAIRFFDLAHGTEHGGCQHVGRVSADWLAFVRGLGRSIIWLNGVPQTEVARWVEHGRKSAIDRGLKVVPGYHPIPPQQVA